MGQESKSIHRQDPNTSPAPGILLPKACIMAGSQPALPIITADDTFHVMMADAQNFASAHSFLSCIAPEDREEVSRYIFTRHENDETAMPATLISGARITIRCKPLNGQFELTITDVSALVSRFQAQTVKAHAGRMRAHRDSMLRFAGNLFDELYELDLLNGQCATYVLQPNGTFEKVPGPMYDILRQRIRRQVHPLDLKVFDGITDFAALDRMASMKQPRRECTVRVRKNDDFYFSVRIAITPLPALSETDRYVMITMRNAEIATLRMKAESAFARQTLHYLVLLDVKRDQYWCPVCPNKPIRQVQEPVSGFFTSLNRIVNQYVVPQDRAKLLANLSPSALIDALRASPRVSYDYHIFSPDDPRRTRIRRITACLYDPDTFSMLLAVSDAGPAPAATELQAGAYSALLAEELSRVSHDVRTPLNAITGLATLCRESPQNEELLKANMDKISSSAQYLLSLFGDLVDVLMIEAGQITRRTVPADMHDFLQELLSPLVQRAEKKGVHIKAGIVGDVQDMYAMDVDLLHQALTHVLSNAIKFTYPGGAVRLNICLKKRTERIDQVDFIISDTGIGISPAFMGELFKPFTQEEIQNGSEFTGSGLGLCIARHITDTLGGKISAQSVQGEGSVFTVSMPLSRINSRRPSRTFGNLRALIALSDEMDQARADDVMRSMGMTTRLIPKGEDIVSATKALWAQGEHFDVMLLSERDCSLAGALREIFDFDAVALLVTSLCPQTATPKVIQAGCDGVIGEPVFAGDVDAMLKKLLLEAITPQAMLRDVDFTGRRILLVEDHDLSVEIARNLLVRKGASVDVAKNGRQALERFSASDEFEYSAILMDIRMPVMNGLDAARAIRMLPRKDATLVPIVAMTANSFPDDVRLSQQNGMNAHLNKPIDARLLYQVLTQYFQSSSSIRNYTDET